MTLPERMTDRWSNRADPAPGQRILYWHVLMRDYPEVGELARQAHQRLAQVTGLHMTPLEWLHMTTLVAGPADQFSDQQMQHMVKTASDCLADVAPIRVNLGKILYHPEAVMLAVTPADALAPIRTAALAATHTVTGRTCQPEHRWTPHVTLAYSTADQPAQAITDALGTYLPARQTELSTLSLVIQEGPERAWRWTTVGTARMRPSQLAV